MTKKERLAKVEMAKRLAAISLAAQMVACCLSAKDSQPSIGLGFANAALAITIIICLMNWLG